VVGANNKAEYRPVEIGPLAGNLRIIRTGLKPGDRVIVGGLQKVKPGDTVSPVVIKTDLSTDLSQFETGPQRVAMINSVGRTSQRSASPAKAGKTERGAQKRPPTPPPCLLPGRLP
jgi:hypothetical protein